MTAGPHCSCMSCENGNYDDCYGNSASPDELRTDLANLRALLKDLAPWMHAAYDRPPQTPEAKALLSRLDEALGLPAN